MTKKLTPIIYFCFFLLISADNYASSLSSLDIELKPAVYGNGIKAEFVKFNGSQFSQTEKKVLAVWLKKYTAFLKEKEEEPVVSSIKIDDLNITLMPDSAFYKSWVQKAVKNCFFSWFQALDNEDQFTLIGLLGGHQITGHSLPGWSQKVSDYTKQHVEQCQKNELSSQDAFLEGRIALYLAERSYGSHTPNDDYHLLLNNAYKIVASRIKKHQLIRLVLILTEWLKTAEKEASKKAFLLKEKWVEQALHAVLQTQTENRTNLEHNLFVHLISSNHSIFYLIKNLDMAGLKPYLDFIEWVAELCYEKGEENMPTCSKHLFMINIHRKDGTLTDLVRF
jgi:hypothetical protein